jgi:hypothetical protein
MNGRALLPFIIDVIAHVLDQLRNEMRVDRFMFAAFDRYARGPEVSGEQADSGKCLAMKAKYK